MLALHPLALLAAVAVLEVALHFITATVLFGRQLPGLVVTPLILFPRLRRVVHPVAEVMGLAAAREILDYRAPLPAREIRATPVPPVLMEAYLQG